MRTRVKKKSAQMYAATEIGGIVAFKSTKNNDRFAHSEICIFFLAQLQI